MRSNAFGKERATNKKDYIVNFFKGKYIMELDLDFRPR